MSPAEGRGLKFAELCVILRSGKTLLNESNEARENPGAFYSVKWLRISGWLSSLVPVQPFADIVGDYTRKVVVYAIRKIIGLIGSPYRGGTQTPTHLQP